MNSQTIRRKSRVRRTSWKWFFAFCIALPSACCVNCKLCYNLSVFGCLLISTLPEFYALKGQTALRPNSLFLGEERFIPKPIAATVLLNRGRTGRLREPPL
jgi:hypothetical protein